MNTTNAFLFSCAPYAHKSLITGQHDAISVRMPWSENRKAARSIVAIVLVLIVGHSSMVSLAVLTSQRSISTSGIIADSSLISPLHTDGIYVKDSANRTVYLRGVNIPSGFTQSSTGVWYENGDWMWGKAYTQWDELGANQRLAELHNYGMNTVRLPINIEWWQNDRAVNLDGQATNIHIRDAVTRTIHIAAQHNLYVILCIGTGVPEDTFPTASSFVNFWISIADLYANETNVIFDLWGEPAGDYNTWMNYAQQATAAIRQRTDNLIKIQYGYCGSYGYVDDFAPLLQPYGNVIFGNHIYRNTYGSTFDPNSQTTRTYIESRLRTTWDYNAAIGKVPMIITEIGAYIPNGANEVTWFTNTLSLLNEWGAGYTYWEWGQLGTGWQIQVDDGNDAPYPLSSTGQIFVNAIASG